MKISEVVAQTIEATGSGVSADTAAKALLVNVLQDEMPFQAIELKELRHLLPMMRDADHPHIYGEASTFYFTAHYLHSEDFPIGRSYFIRATDLFEIGRIYQFFREAGLHLPTIAPKELGVLVDEEGFRERIQAYKARKKIELAPFKGLFEGREGARTVSNSIFLNSTGCLMCGHPQFVMMTCTSNAGAGTMVGFNLCQEHLEESQKFNSLLEWVFRTTVTDDSGGS